MTVLLFFKKKPFPPLISLNVDNWNVLCDFFVNLVVILRKHKHPLSQQTPKSLIKGPILQVQLPASLKDPTCDVTRQTNIKQTSWQLTSSTSVVCVPLLVQKMCVSCSGTCQCRFLLLVFYPAGFFCSCISCCLTSGSEPGTGKLWSTAQNNTLTCKSTACI